MKEVPHNQADEVALLDRCRAGDQAAWGVLVDQYAGLVVAVARNEGMTPEQCDDVFQSVFTALFADVDRIRSEHALPAWLSQVTKRTCWRVARAARRDATGSEPAADVASPSAASDGTDREAVRWALNQLPARCRELLEGLFIEDPPATYESLAARLGVPPGSLGPTRRRCLAKLAELLPVELRAGGDQSDPN